MTKLKEKKPKYSYLYCAGCGKRTEGRPGPDRCNGQARPSIAEGGSPGWNGCFPAGEYIGPKYEVNDEEAVSLSD